MLLVALRSAGIPPARWPMKRLRPPGALSILLPPMLYCVVASKMSAVQRLPQLALPPPVVIETEPPPLLVSVPFETLNSVTLATVGEPSSSFTARLLPLPPVAAIVSVLPVGVIVTFAPAASATLSVKPLRFLTT